ncbi:MAG: hypothetical protein WA890_28285, partial [Micromonospora sp.]
MMVREHPAHYVLWDLLADAGGQVVINAPLFERRARLAEVLEDAPAQLTLTPQTTDMDEVGDWLTTYTAAGIEGWSSSGWTAGTSPAGAAGRSSGCAR